MESRHNIADVIVLDFYSCGQLMGGIIAGIKFTDYGKVLYDIKLRPFSNEEMSQELVTVLKDVDSYFIKTEYDKIIEGEK